MDISLIVSLLVLGGLIGYVAGLLGVGGGMLLTPFLAMLFAWQGMPEALIVHAAIATAMATILFTSISSLSAHQRNGNVQWGVVRAMAPGLILGGLIVGGGVFAVIDGSWLALFFAFFVAYNGIRMLTRKTPVLSAPSKPVGQFAMFAAATAIGAVCGLVGAGGAFLSVPFMVRAGIPIHRAIGTSAALGFPIALANSVGYIYSGWGEAADMPSMVGYIHIPALLIIASTSVLAAPFGARASSRMPVARIKMLFGCLLLSLATYMAIQAIRGFTA